MLTSLRVTLLAAAACLAAGTASATILETVRARGEVRCGVHLGLAGFGYPDAQGNWRGLDVEFCRALAAAIFNDPNKVRFIPTSPAQRFTVVQTGEVDIVARNATYTLLRDTSLGLNWPAINFFDGQGFMVRRSANVTSVRQLDGASVCVTQGTTTELNLADYFRTHNMRYEVVVFATNQEGAIGLQAGRCDAYTTDMSGLAAERLNLNNPEEFVVLPEMISKEPLGPIVRHGDEQWTDIVRWTHYAMVNAEELGVTRANVEEMRASASPEIRRLLGVEARFGEALGLTNDWAFRIIRHIGNYGESYERNVGMGSPLRIPRGANDLWTRGGQQYGYPIR